MISTVAFLLIVAALITQITFIIIDHRKPDPFSHYILSASTLLLIISVIQRSLAIDFIALTNTFESLLLFSIFIEVIVIVYRLKEGAQTIPFLVFGLTVLAMALMAIASSPIIPQDIRAPVPALQSSWLLLHVSLSFVGESFFAVSFVTSIIYLFSKNEESKKKLDTITYRFIAIAYPIFTTGALVLGAVWAYFAWGRFWGWDPKETWSLITWLVYTAYLHARLIMKWRGKATAVLSIIGFLLAGFTFFGVNFLLSSLHSY